MDVIWINSISTIPLIILLAAVLSVLFRLLADDNKLTFLERNDWSSQRHRYPSLYRKVMFSIAAQVAAGLAVWAMFFLSIKTALFWVPYQSWGPSASDGTNPFILFLGVVSFAATVPVGHAYARAKTNAFELSKCQLALELQSNLDTCLVSLSGSTGIINSLQQFIDKQQEPGEIYLSGIRREYIEKADKLIRAEEGKQAKVAWDKTREAKPEETKLEVANTNERSSITDEEFSIARGHYEPLFWITSISNVISYRIDGQVKLSSGKLQVTFSVGDVMPGQDNETIYEHRYVCIVSYDNSEGRWIIEEHKGPVEI
jgi:hypothetical protein